MKRKARTTQRDRPLALGYVRVSTDGQALLGASLDAQTAMIRESATTRGWDLEVHAETKSGSSMTARPVLTALRARLNAHDADALIATRMDRISRSVHDMSGLVQDATANGWGIVFTTESFDLNTPGGRFTANVWISAAQYERELISARTREGMAAKRNETGRHMGRHSTLPDALIHHIQALRAQGTTYQAIANQLNARAVPTPRGAPWRVSSVQSALNVKTNRRPKKGIPQP